MKSINLILSLTGLLFLSSCVSMFIPEITESQDLLVVEGMITDRPGPNTIKLSKSMPLGRRTDALPLSGCNVILTDDLGNSYSLSESEEGTYITDSSEFCGIVGRYYTLKILTNNVSTNFFSYESLPMEMKPVPPIQNLYYERKVIEVESEGIQLKEGCQIYLDTQDPDDNCKYYRWNYTETWVFSLPFDVPNRVCWITNNSTGIQIKNTGHLSENKITQLPVKFVSNETDRLSIKYSMLVNQYSLNDEEFNYWEKMQNITQNIGSLYDITPASIPGNIYCIEDPNEKVLGFFSVSAKSSKRIFIDDRFSGLVNLYPACPIDTVRGPASVPILYLGSYLWVIVDGTLDMPPFRVLTDKKGCADCTVRGSKVEPPFWNDNK